MEWFTHGHIIFRHLTLTTQVPVFTWPVSILALQRAELANVIIVPFPSPCWKLRGFFPPIFTARPWENSLSQSHQSVETPLWRVPPEFNPRICPHWAPGDCQSLGFLSPLFPWRCLLGAGWGGVGGCLCSSKWWVSQSPLLPFFTQTFALWPHFSGKSESCWFSGFFSFLLVKTGRWLLNSLHDRPETGSLSLYFCFCFPFYGTAVFSVESVS